ncbi:hypothetical protein ACOKW7_16110 [Limnospira platensis CENA597]|uniref:hypothetical protein n=1 Tax=Limnospira platensis TaxID=118562 RepID=UPI003D6E3F20
MEQNYPENLDLNLLQDYYQALHAINTQHLKLLDAQRELSWHNSRKKEAYKLAQQLGINDISSLPTTDCNYVSGEKTDRDRINKALNDINITLEKIKNINNMKKGEIENIKNQKKYQLESLKNQNIQVGEKLDEIEKKIENLKNQKMLRLVSTVIVAVVVTIVWQDFATTFWVTLIYFLIILSVE